MKKQNPEDMTIHRYLDGELDAGQTAEFEKQLEDSPEMRREIESIRAVSNAVRGAMQAEVEQVDFRRMWAAVNAAIDEEEAAGSESLMNRIAQLLFPNTARKLAAAAAAGVVIVAGLFAMMHFVFIPQPAQAELPTSVSIEYGDIPDIVIAVDAVSDSNATVVWIDGLTVDEESEE